MSYPRLTTDERPLTAQLSDDERAELAAIRAERRQEDEAALLRELKRYSSSLLPGAPEAMAAGPCKDLARHREPGQLARAVCEYVRGPYAESFRKLSGPDAAPPGDPLRAVLNRHAADLKDGALEKLYDAMAIRYARRPEPEVAQEVARVLSDHRSNHLLRKPNELPREVQAVRTALEVYSHQLKRGAIEELSERWAADGRHLPHEALTALVATRLTLPGNQEFLRVEAFDPRDREWPKPAPPPTSGGPASPATAFGTAGGAPPEPPFRRLAKI